MWTVDQVHEATKIDKWFLRKLRNIAEMREACVSAGGIDELFKSNGIERMRSLKVAGFSDRQIARYLGREGLQGEAEIRAIRKRMKIIPCVKQIDTLAAEFPAQTNYLYMTYSGYENDVDESEIPTSLKRRKMSKSPSAMEFEKRVRSLSEVQEGQTLADFENNGVMVLGCGAYCIGSSVEFDWCAVSAVRQLRREGIKSVIVNYNPETVSSRVVPYI